MKNDKGKLCLLLFSPSSEAGACLLPQLFERMMYGLVL